MRTRKAGEDDYVGHYGYVFGSEDSRISLERRRYKHHQHVYATETEHLDGDENVGYWVKASHIDIGYRLEAFGRTVDIVIDSIENDSPKRVEKYDSSDA